MRFQERDTSSKYPRITYVYGKPHVLCHDRSAQGHIARWCRCWSLMMETWMIKGVHLWMIIHQVFQSVTCWSPRFTNLWKVHLARHPISPTITASPTGRSPDLKGKIYTTILHFCLAPWKTCVKYEILHKHSGTFRWTMWIQHLSFCVLRSQVADLCFPTGLSYPVHKGSCTQEEQQQSRQSESAPDKRE